MATAPDTDYNGPLDSPQCTGDDISYMLTALNEALTVSIVHSDITGVWAGLRPLVASDAADADSSSTTDLSRQHQVAESPNGVVRVNGGKLTTYREMAEDTVDHVSGLLGRRRHVPRRRSTRRMPLLGAGNRPSQSMDAIDEHLWRRYGSFSDEIRALIALDLELAAPLVAGQPYLKAEAVYAVRHEMATTLGDVLIRRTRSHLFDRAATLDAAPSTARLIASELGWDDAQIEREINNYRQLCADEEESAHEHESQITNAAD